MSLTQEQKKIADEVWIKYSQTDAHINDMFDEFLSRIREEQGAYDFMSESKNNKDVHVCVDKDYPGNVKWTKAFPVFTIPPAAPEMLDIYQLQEDYAELVEALEFAQKKLLESAYPYDEAAHRVSEALAKHKVSMGEK